MAKSPETCDCGMNKSEETCPVCREAEPWRYWCETCKRVVAGKRCPLCGLKARKIRPDNRG
jgi:predicted RNA-binding protein with PUA domain